MSKKWDPSVDWTLDTEYLVEAHKIARRRREIGIDEREIKAKAFITHGMTWTRMQEEAAMKAVRHRKIATNVILEGIMKKHAAK